MGQVFLIASFEACPGKSSLLKSALLEIVRHSKNDAGCIIYDFFMDKENANRFFLYERWQSRELWHKHLKTPYIHKFTKDTKGILSQWQLHELQKVN